ncbi:hypothetical protein O181_046963 [Austropuccinia psidii MF-1]|uniref:Uncharacterized protein n=1 Tax=Austropuccinia psidii MF-1 TaxID=1389203 RepID=A0A9Q3HJ21_9BASI|nr:hypothetical protein [Austropuccinia psidii MF-1]
MKSSNKTNRALVPSYSKVLGQAALEACKFDLNKFLEVVSERYRDQLLPLEGQRYELAIQKMSYLMQASFLKVQVFASFAKESLLKDDVVDGFEATALKILGNFWQLTFFGHYPGMNQEPKNSEDSLKMLQLIPMARANLHLSQTNRIMWEPATWHAATLCVQSLWKVQLKRHHKTQIYEGIILRAQEMGLE